MTEKVNRQELRAQEHLSFAIQLGTEVKKLLSTYDMSRETQVRIAEKELKKEVGAGNYSNSDISDRVIDNVNSFKDKVTPMLMRFGLEMHNVFNYGFSGGEINSLKAAFRFITTNGFGGETVPRNMTSYVDVRKEHFSDSYYSLIESLLVIAIKFDDVDFFKEIEKYSSDNLNNYLNTFRGFGHAIEIYGEVNSSEMIRLRESRYQYFSLLSLTFASKKVYSYLEEKGYGMIESYLEDHGFITEDDNKDFSSRRIHKKLNPIEVENAMKTDTSLKSTFFKHRLFPKKICDWITF